MQIDFAIRVGSSHPICQDYARVQGDVVMLSDGCSSSLDTDIGARLLVLEAMSLDIKEFDRPPIMMAQAAKGALEKAEGLGLSKTILDATLSALWINNGWVNWALWGDGVMAVKAQSGRIAAWEVEYPSGFPFYPTYDYQPARAAACKAAGRGVIRIYSIVNRVAELRFEEKLTSRCFETMALIENGDDPLVSAAIFSDGISSFSRRESNDASVWNTSIGLGEMLTDMMSFRGKGKFAERRVHGFIKRNPDVSHYDDFSMGAILM